MNKPIIRRKQLSLEEIKVLADSQGLERLDENVVLSLWDLVGYDIEAMNDLVEEILVGHKAILADIEYVIVGTVVRGDETCIILNVNAEVQESV